MSYEDMMDDLTDAAVMIAERDKRIEELKSDLLQERDWLDQILTAYIRDPTTNALANAIISVRAERRKAREVK